MKQIPIEVNNVAKKIFCEEAEYLGDYNEFEVYVKKIPTDDIPQPTGIPILILWDGKNTKTISGMESLELLSYFD